MILKICYKHECFNFRNSVFILLFITLLQSCVNRNEEIVADRIITINPSDAQEEILLSDFVESIEYIKLETLPDCMIGFPLQLIIRERYIYVLDLLQQAVCVFDNEGSYITKLDKQGRGPGEYENIAPIVVDVNEEFLAMATYTSNGSSLLKYSIPSFVLIEESPIQSVNANQFRIDGDYLYFGSQQGRSVIGGEFTNAAILIVKDGEVVGKLFDKRIETGGSSFSPNFEAFTRNDSGELFTSVMYDNTFYRLDGLRAEPVITVDFGSYGIDNSIGYHSLDEQIDYIRQIGREALFPVLTINNSNIMSFSYYVGTGDSGEFDPFTIEGFDLFEYHQYFELKKSGQTYHAKFIRNDLTAFPDNVYISTYYRKVAHEAWYEDYLVDVVIPGNHFSEDEFSEVNGLGRITSEDNPVIVLMKIK